jgi:hypothetical protein
LAGRGDEKRGEEKRGEEEQEYPLDSTNIKS